MDFSPPTVSASSKQTSACLGVGSFCRRLLLWGLFAGFYLGGHAGSDCQAQSSASETKTEIAVTRARAAFYAPSPTVHLQRPSTPGHSGYADKSGRYSGRLKSPAGHDQTRPSVRVPVTGESQNTDVVQQVALQELILPPIPGHTLSQPNAGLSGSRSVEAEPALDTDLPATEAREFTAGSSAMEATESPFDSGPVDLSVPAAGDPTDGDGDHELLWWESNLPRSMLRGRTPISLTLHRALGLALTEAPELQVLHSDWYIQQTEVDRLNAAFDWTTFVDTVWNRDSTPVSSALDGATNRLRSRSLNASAGVRRLSMDGAQVELSQSAGLLNSNSQFISPNNQATTRLALQYERPLLRGAGEDYNTSPQRLAEIQKDTAFDRFQAGVQDHLLQVATAYWTLVMRRGRFVQAVQSWQRAIAIADEMEGRTEVDVTPAMLDRARSEVATRLATAVEAEHDILRTQNSLLRLIYGARFSEFADGEVVTTTLPMRPGQPLSAKPQIERALQKRSEVHQAIREIRAASIRYNVAASEVLPALDLVLTSYVAGLHGDNDVGRSLRDQFSEGEPGVGIGLNFEIPYRNRAAQAFAEQTHIGIKRVEAQLQATLGQVAEDVRDQVVQRNKFGAVLDQRRESLVRARRILGYTETRREVLADGTDVADLYLENLLSMQSRLEDAESEYLTSQIRYTLADNALLRAVSELETIARRESTCQTCHAETTVPGTRVAEGVDADKSTERELATGSELAAESELATESDPGAGGHSLTGVRPADTFVPIESGEPAAARTSVSFGHTLK